MKKKRYIRPHYRRLKRKRGRTKVVKVKGHNKNIPTINPRERKIFRYISDPDRFNVEYGGGIDFKKDGSVENINVGVGEDMEIDLPEDFEVIYHTHPTKNLSLPTPEDVVSLIKSRQQQAELVFQGSKAYIIKKTPRSKPLGKVPDRKLYKQLDNIWHKATNRNNEKGYKRDLEALGFEVDINTKPRRPMIIRVVPK